MAKFKIRAMAIDFFEEDIEAENEEKARNTFMDKFEKGEFNAEEFQVYFEGEDEFDALNEMFEEG